MSFTPSPDRDSLPLKKRDQRLSSPPQQHHRDAATFKAPYPYRSPHPEFKTKPTSPFQPVPRRVPALHQPWMHVHTSTRPTPPVLSAFREHHGWAEWREFNPLHSGWDFSHHYQQHANLSGTSAVHPGYSNPSSGFSPVPLVSERLQVGGGYDWEQLKALRDKAFNTDRQTGRNKWPYVRRRDRNVEHFLRVEKANAASLRTCLPLPPHEDPQHVSTNRHPVSERSFRRVPPGDDSNSAYASMGEVTARPPVQPASPSRLPWLLPHFVAGSLIELRDGRLRRVEHLQTEDFLLGSLACPDLQLSCCTVQSISPAASPSISRLLILLHDLQSQELVDVYVEYPFFVRGLGWSSCSPQRTARLCGLQCRQLSVGDVCLALTPVSALQPPPPTALRPNTSPGESAERGCEGLKVSHPRALAGPQGPAGAKQDGEGLRRRHCSAPELRGPGTNCM